MTEQKEFVDFNIGLGDTGQDNISAIQPVANGEGAIQTVFRRPAENLRERTETLRDTVGELLYYRDYSHLMIEYTGGTITWNGAAPGAPPLGQITITAGSFTLAPMLAPYQAKKGTLSVGTPASNQVIYTVAAAAYATHGMNAVTIKHLHSAAAAVVSVSISDGPVKRIVVTFNSGNTSHDAAAVQSALAIAIAADTALAGRLTITTNAAPSVAIAAVAETRLDTTADDEKHVVLGADVQALTVATPLQPGMGIGIWYKYVIEPAGFGADPKGGLAGGRAESSGNRGTSAIPAAALFITSSNPEKIPGAIPLCRVGYNGQLIWYDGTRLQPGESFTFASPTSVASTALSAFVASLAAVTGGSLVGYNGSGFWADGVTAVTAATMEGAIDEIVSDIAAVTATSPGAIRVGVDAPTIFTGPLTATGGGGALPANTTVRAALDQLDAAVISRRALTAVCSDGTTSVGGDVNSAALFAGINTLAIGSGRYFVRRGTYTNAVIPTTVSGLSLAGEHHALVTLVASATHVFVPTPIIANSSFEFEDIYFTATGGATKYTWGSSVLRIKNCRAQAGLLQINRDASMSPYAPTRVDIAGLRIDNNGGISSAEDSFYVGNNNTAAMPIVGTIRDLRITKVPSVTGNAKSALRIEDLANTSENAVLVFENGHFDPDNYAAIGGHVLKVFSSRQPVVFRNSVFRASDTVNAITVLSIDNSSALLFENCTFIQDGRGKVLDVTIVSSGICFKNCKFYTSPLEANYPEFGVTCDGSAALPIKDVVFEDCYVEIRYGSHTGGAAQRRIEIGSSGGTRTGYGSYTIDGLHIALVYVGFDNSGGGTINDMADNTVSISAGYTGKSSVRGRNITIDLQGKRLVGNGTSAILLNGEDSAAFEIDGLHVLNITEGNTAAAPTPAVTLQNSVVQLNGGRINGGSFNGTPAGSNVAAWKALIYPTGVGSSVEGVRFYEDSATANAGRLLYTASQCKILGNSVNSVAFAAGESTPGWFVYVAGSRQVISNNTLRITGGAQNYLMATDDHALIYIPSGVPRCTVSANTVRFDSAAVKAITVGSTGSTIVGNTIELNSGAQETAILLMASNAIQNVVTGNTVTNEGGGTAIIVDNGTSLSFPNRVFGNTTDVNVSAGVNRILGVVHGYALSGWSSDGFTATATAANSPYVFSLNDYLPDGAVIRGAFATVDPNTTASYATGSNRMKISLLSVDKDGTTVDLAGPINDINDTATHDMPVGTVAFTVDKANKIFLLQVTSSAATSTDVLYSVTVNHTTPKFYVD